MSPRILVPFDGSDPARRALECAIDLFPEGEFVALTVADTSGLSFLPNAADEAVPDEFEDMRGEAADRLTGAADVAAERDVPLDARVRVGTPAREIVDFAERGEVDHVVIGSHGRSGVSRILLGSVAEVVVRHSPVPVTVVR